MRPVFFFPRATIVDCGSSHTSVAVVQGGRKGRLRLEQFAVVHHFVEPGPEANWLIKTTEAIALLRSRVKPAGPVTVVLPPHLTLMKMLNTPRVAASKRDKIINFEGQQSIPYPLSEVVWDRLIAGENSHSFNVLLCAAKLDVLDALSSAVTGAGFLPGGLLPSARALVACYREVEPEPAIPTLLIGLGARSTTMALLDKTAFQARSLSLGGWSVTQQIAEMRSIDVAGAEEWKLSPSHADEMAPVARLFASRLCQEIARTLWHFHRPITSENPLRVVLTGGGSRLLGLAGLLATQLNVPVTLFDPTTALEVSDGKGELHSAATDAALADIVGAAVLQFRGAQPSLNLLPPRLRQQAERRRLRPWLAIAAGLAVAAVVPAVTHYHGVFVTARDRNVALERELVPLLAREAREQLHRQRLAEIQRQQAAWQKVADARTSWLKLLDEMQGKFIQTGDVWLEQMRLMPGPAGIPPAGRTDPPAIRLAFSGLMRSKAGPAAGTDPENYERVRSLLASIAETSAVATVESGRFEPTASGLLRFDFVVVLRQTAVL